MKRIDLEKYILASFLQTNLCNMATLLRQDDWSELSHKAVHKIIVERLNKNQPVDESIYNEPDLSNDLILIVAELLAIAPYKDELVLKEKIDELTELSDIQYAAAKFKSAANKAMSVKKSSDLIDFTSNLIDDLITRHPKQLETTIGQSMMEALKELERQKHDGKIKIGIKQIDDFLGGGIKQGEYVVFAARPNIGKSIFTLSPVLATAEKSLSVLMAVNEMSVTDTCIRMLAKRSGVDINVIEMKQAPVTGDYDAISVAQEEMSRMPITFRDKSYNLVDIENIIRARQKLGKPVQLLIVDMAGRLKIEGKRYNKRSDEVADISRNLQRISQQYKCTIIATVQISRAGLMTEEPTLEHLKESGAWEEDTDKVFMMWADKDDKNKRIIAIRKNRKGDTEHKFYVTLDGRHMTFRED